MSYYSYEGCADMAIDYYNATTGVTSRLATGVLLTFMLNGTLTSGRLKQANDNINTSSSSISTTMCSSFYHRSWDQGDPGDWTYAKAELIRSSSLVRGTYLYETYFKNGNIGDKIIWYNKNNASFKMSLEYRGSVTDSGHVYRIGRMRLEVPGLASYYTGDFAISGVDGYNRSREFVWGFVADYQHGYACPYYATYTFDYDSETGNYGTNGNCEVINLYGYVRSNKNEYNNIYRYFMYQIFAGQLPEPTEDPYESNNYGPGENQGGEGDHDETSDPIAIPSDPTLQITSSGMVTIFTPDLTQIQNLATQLIDPNFFQALGNTFASLDEVILGLHIVPLTVPYTGPTTALSINLLGIAYRVAIGLYKASAQILSVDCGTLDVSEYWGNCLDYNPYTKITIFLPFIGYIDIDADDVMGKTVGVKYKVDIATGACVAFITADGSVMYQYAGNCALTIPVSSSDQSSAIQNIVSIATAAVTGGAGIAAAGAAVAEAEGALNAASGYKEIKAAISERDQAKAHYESVTEKNKGKLAGVSANAVVNSKAQFHHGGSLGASAGFMGIKTPYIIIRRPKQMIPDMYGAFNGYPTNTYVQLGELAGYTRVSDIRLNIPDATVDEILECERLLKEGVVL